jgi:hypothetical protein
MLERSGAELQRLRADMKKLQMQNWNLAQSNSLMLAVISSSSRIIVNIISRFCKVKLSQNSKPKILRIIHSGLVE